MVQTILDARLDVRRNALHKFLAEVALDDVAAERQRQAGFFQPPLAKIEDLVKSYFPVCELALMNEKTGVIIALLNFVENPVEWHDLVFDLRFEEAQREEGRRQRAGNSDHL